MRSRPLLPYLLAMAALLVGACGSVDAGSSADGTEADAGADSGVESGGDSDAGADSVVGTGTGVRLISPIAGSALVDRPPADLVVLDVRTAEEFGEGHLAGATMLDFYADDFADRIAELDRDRPYLIYCRSGNRSGQTRALMEDLGFADVADVDGGILAWTAADLPLQP